MINSWNIQRCLLKQLDATFIINLIWYIRDPEPEFWIRNSALHRWIYQGTFGQVWPNSCHLQGCDESDSFCIFFDRLLIALTSNIYRSIRYRPYWHWIKECTCAAYLLYYDLVHHWFRKYSSPLRCQVTFYIHSDMTPTVPVGTNVNEIWLQQLPLTTNGFENIICKFSAILSKGQWVVCRYEVAQQWEIPLEAVPEQRGYQILHTAWYDRWKSEPRNL